MSGWKMIQPFQNSFQCHCATLSTVVNRSHSHHHHHHHWCSACTISIRFQ